MSMWPTKPGGGNLPQPYDPKNGEYVDMTDDEILTEEMRRVELYRRFNTRYEGYDGHFPTLGFHSDEYNRLWVEAYRRHFKAEIVAIEKVGYLLTHLNEDDKSGSFISFGYNPNKPEELKEDIIKGSDFNRAIYNKIDKYGLRILVPTTLKNDKKVITTWIFDNKRNRQLKLTSALTRKDKYEKIFKTRG